MPIIVVSAREGDTSKVAALDAGADDYVTKPFSITELLARVRASLRRHQPVVDEPIVETSDFVVDFVARRVTKHGAAVHLTPTEWSIVEYLVRHPGRLVTQRQLLQRVWGPQYENETNYLRVHMAAIRRKLEPTPDSPGISSPIRVSDTDSRRLDAFSRAPARSCRPPDGDRHGS